MTCQPLISIGMSVRNNHDTVADAIRSILNQTYPEWELILIDDGSADQHPGDRPRASPDRESRIRLFADGSQKGLPARLNESIDAANGDVLCADGRR